MSFAPLKDRSGRQRAGVYRDPLIEAESGFGAAFATGADAGLMGPGSLGENIQQYMVERDTGREDDSFWGGVGYTMGKAGFSLGSIVGLTGDLDREGVPLKREDWEQSEFYRPDLEYRDGLTDVSAAVLANRHDRDKKAAAVMQQATLLQSGGAMAGTVGTAIFDIKNVAVGLGAYGALRGAVAGARGVAVARQAARARTSTRLAFGFAASGRPVTIGEAALQGARSVKQSAKVIAAEAAIGTVPISMTAMAASDTLQTEYGWGDFAADMFSSVGMSVSIGAFSKALGKVWATHTSKRDANIVLDLARAQLQRGEPLDVKPFVEMQIAEKHVPLTTLTKEQRVNPVVERVGKKNRYTAVYPNESGELSVVKGKGKTPEEAISNLEEIYETGDVSGQEQIQYSEAYYKKLANYEMMKDQLDAFDVDKAAEAEFRRRAGISAKKERAEITKDLKRAKKRKAKATAEERGAIFYEQLFDAYDAAKLKQKHFEKAVADARKDLIETKKAEKAPAFQDWVRRQVNDEELPPVREKIEEKAATAGSSEVDVAADEVALLRQMATDEGLPAAQRRNVEDALKAYDAIQKLPDVVENFIACRGGRL